MKLLDDSQVATREAQPTSKTPVTDEEATANIRASIEFEYPILAPQPVRAGSAIFVAGGPTLREFLPEIRRRSEAGEYVFTSNHTHDFLIEQGIVPNACLLFDPKEKVKDYVKLVHPECAYLMGVCVNRMVWETMRDRGARMLKVMVAYGLPDDSDMKLMNELYPNVKANHYVPGGTMTALRAIPLAGLLGFKKIELYGFDSCFSPNEPRMAYSGTEEFKSKQHTQAVYHDDHGDFIIDEPEDGGFFYAYKKRRGETIQICEHKGRKFLSSPVFVHQAMQIEKWYDRLESQVDIVIHGDSLSAWVLSTYKEELDERRVKIGDRRWTEEYAEQMRLLHEEGKFGIVGYSDIEWAGRALVSILCMLQRPITVLDYGAGAGTFSEAIEKLFKLVKVTNYDPFHPKWKDDPEPEVHDVVHCTDVMEHVELECVENTLKYIAEHTRFMACFMIGTEDAQKQLPDGRNAHITQKSPKWWAEKLRVHFVIVDYMISSSGLVLICHHRDMEDRIQADGALDRTMLGGRLHFASKVGGL